MRGQVHYLWFNRQGKNRRLFLCCHCHCNKSLHTRQRRTLELAQLLTRQKTFQIFGPFRQVSFIILWNQPVFIVGWLAHSVSEPFICNGVIKFGVPTVNLGPPSFYCPFASHQHLSLLIYKINCKKCQSIIVSWRNRQGRQIRFSYRNISAYINDGKH